MTKTVMTTRRIEKCEACAGTRELGNAECPECDGSGVQWATAAPNEIEEVKTT
mgnify:FL=1